MQLLPWFVISKVALCQRFEYLWERKSSFWLLCSQHHIFTAPSGSSLWQFYALIKVRVEISFEKCAYFSHPGRLQIKSQIKLLKTDDCDNGYKVMNEEAVAPASLRCSSRFRRCFYFQLQVFVSWKERNGRRRSEGYEAAAFVAAQKSRGGALSLSKPLWSGMRLLSVPSARRG